VGLALARIQLIGEQAILKRSRPGAPRLTALGLDREAAPRARQRVSAEIVALPVSCSSDSDPEAETSAARDRFRTKAATRRAPADGPEFVRGSQTGPGGAGCLLARPNPTPSKQRRLPLAQR
jgi:hypothetical protein